MCCAQLAVDLYTLSSYHYHRHLIIPCTFIANDLLVPHPAISTPNVTVLAKEMWMRSLSMKRKVYDTDCGTAEGTPASENASDVG